jgi:predicted DNA-binding protein
VYHEDTFIEGGIIAMSPRAARRNFYLSDLQLKRLNSMSKRLGLSASEILRRAIDEYWERFEKKERR